MYERKRQSFRSMWAQALRLRKKKKENRMKKRVVCLLLTLAMLLGMLPAMALAANEHAITASSKTAYETTQGAMLTIPMSEVFTDSEGHEMTYTLNSTDLGEHTSVSNHDTSNPTDTSWKLFFTQQKTGVYTASITAACAEEASVTATASLTITVKEGEKGDERQYGYDETPQDSVRVYVTISSDGIPIRGKDGTVLSHLKVDVPYFDLDNHGLSEFYRYHTENGSGSYMDTNIVQRPTAMHLFLYMVGVYYLGYTPQDVVSGRAKIVGADGGRGVEYMTGGTAYEDTKHALNYTGSATSTYMQQFWGHDENLMYYRNHVYPLKGPGWGATSDYMLLSDDDTIDVALFTDWSFWNDGGAFACFDLDEYSVQPGKSVTFSTMKYDTKSVADGGTETMEPITGLTVSVYDENWEKVADVEPLTAGGSSYTYTFPTAGTYYLLGIDPNAGTTSARKAPATAKVTVGSGEKPFDPAEYYKDFDFASISLDAENTDYIYNISESMVKVEGMMSQNQGEKKVYTVTVPEDTKFVYVTYPADFEETILSYCAFFNMKGTEDWSLSSSDFAVTENEDGTHTITLPAAYCMENDTCIALENSSYSYFNSFYFVAGENTRPGGSDKVSVTGVKLDKTELTVNRGEKAELTATVLPGNATNQKLSWQSANQTIATVRNGAVTGVSAGQTTIIVTTADGGYTAECAVTVTDKNKPARAEDGYYEIANAAQLKWFADEVNSGNPELNARLTNDIDLSSVCSKDNPWAPIGDHSANQDYRGTFNGQDHKITNLYLENTGDFVNGSSYYTGLFGLCDGATLKNLSVYGEAKAITRYVAGIVGRACDVSSHRSTTIENCHNFVTLTGSPTNNQIYGHAGVVATAQNTVIRGCSNQADITGYEGYTGGIVAVADYGEITIENCRNTGKVHLRGWQSSFRGVGGIAGCLSSTATVTNCYNTGNVSFYYRTQKIEQAAGGIVGLAGKSSGSSKITLTSCYSTGAISGEYDDNASMGALVGAATGANTTLTVEKCYYLDGAVKTSGAETTTVTVQGTAFTAANGLGADALGEGYVDSCPAPVLKGQTAVAHADANSDGACDVCGKVLTEAVKVPHLIAGVSAEKKDTVQVGTAYLLSELQAGRIFEGPDGEKLTYTNYYYQRSTDGGQTWGEQMHFTEALFGGTTIQITELEAGTYTYRFTASTDGKNFSADTWTLTLNVVKDAPLDFTVNVGRDYNYKTNGNVYPIIKVYPSLGWDEQTGEAIPDKDNPVTLLYSDFTSALPEGTTAYDPAKGTLVNNYNTFYLSVPAGDYYFESWGWDAEAQDYTVSLGGMPLTLPTDTNVDGGAGGGNTLYLQCNSFYVSSRKADNTSFFTADEYYVKLVCPIMGGSATMGEPYVSGNYAYYPVMLYAAGNACLYNVYAYPTIEGYIFTQTINQTYRAGYSANTKNLSINVELTLAVTVPSEANFNLYFQWNNFNTTAVEPFGSWKDNGDGTKTIEYPVSKGNGNYTWRLSDGTHVTQAGWLASQSANAAVSFSFAADAPTDRHSHDFSKLGSATKSRDEADLQVNLDPSGYEAVGETTRVRAYRHWEIINSDAGNIMIEPDFHWFVYRGDAKLQTVDGGNTTANWADVTPGAQDSILTVYYDSVNVNPGSYGTHGGLYPATQPNRLGVIVVGGTGVTHGTADADVDFNMDSGTATTRSMAWDYNYDTWFYGANETAPTLDFAVKATGSVTVEYAFVTATENLDTVMQDYKAVSAGSDGRYAVPLAGFRSLGAGKGGTVILKMTDSTGTSYRLVRVAEVTITAENVSNPKEVIMPGDEVRLTFRGMYRAVNKISGVFNPLIFEPTYYYGGTKYTGKLGQYQRMDNAAVAVTVPKDVEFAEGSDTAELRLTDGYTFGSMYSAANPFAFLYNMTDTGAGTNFNAPTVTYYMNHYADAVITVSRKVLYDTALRITDEEGKALTDVTVTLTGPDGAVTADENGRYQLGYGSYSYTLVKSGYVCTRGSFSLGSADAEKLQNGVLTLTLAEMVPAGENPWDGAAKTEPQKDGSGAYLIGTAAELAWYAASDGKTAAKLTADIELAGFDWTPMKNLCGKFDGQGHVVRNLYINSSSYPAGLFGYVKTGASVTRLGVTGSVTCTATSNAQAGGVAGYLEANAQITECFSTVDVSSRKHGGGIAGYVNNGAVISDCYATGSITTTSPNECYLGGVCASGWNNTYGATLTNCYFAGTVTGSGGNASYVGGIACDKTESRYSNCFYLAGTVSGESPKYGVTGKGTAKTADELRALAGTLGDKFAAGQNGVNGGFPVLAWQNGGSEPVILLGDVNGDGKVDNFDAALTYAKFNGKYDMTEEQLKAADVNGDGMVDNFDAALIYARFNGKLKEFPAEQ